MEHVSTFCAISTIGIAASGFALGRAEKTPPRPSLFRKKVSLRDECARVTDTAPSLCDTLPSGPVKLPATAEVPTASNVSSALCQDESAFDQNQHAHPNAPRKSSLAGILLRRRGQTLSNPPSRFSEDTSMAFHASRPSSSWIRRLSFQPEKHISCQPPISPSYNGRISTSYSRPSSQRRAPNKLVKRPPSQYSNAQPLFGNAPPSPSNPSSFRRPATSYQRSGTQKHRPTHSLQFEPGSISNSLSQSPGVEVPETTDGWQSYLNVNSNSGPLDRLSCKLPSAARPREQGPQLILPSADALPVLLMATSITHGETVAEADREVAPAVAPVQFRDPFKPDATPSIQPGPEPESSLPPSRDNRQASPPINEVDAKPDIARPAIADATEVQSVCSKRRVVSMPLPETPKSEGTTGISHHTHIRRNITDPSAFAGTSAFSHVDKLPSVVVGRRRRIFPSYSRTDMNSLRDYGRPLSSDAAALSSQQGSIRMRPNRHSIAASDPASTIIGSDDSRVFSSGDEDESDFLTDTAFDSIRTHMTTASSSGIYAHRLEAIFDDPKGCARDDVLSHVEGLVTQDKLSSQRSDQRHPDISTDPGLAPMSTSIPAKETNPPKEDSQLSFLSNLADDNDSHSLVAKLPGDLVGPALKTKELSCRMSDLDERCTFIANQRPGAPFGLDSNMQADLPGLATGARDPCPKLNIFDWSEQPRNDREATGSEGRPQTVHAKKGPDFRGSRTSSRNAPSHLHLRSQSVPVSRDPPAVIESRQTSGKFGTWGLGSKGVSEDWDSDFDFEDDEATPTAKPTTDISKPGMVVPRAIMERQASLHGQFGHVQELTLLVEELKRLRHRASFLGIVRDSSNELWKEAEGIVDLATLDDDEDRNNSPPGSPASLTFSFDESEGEISNTHDPWKRASGDSWRAPLSEKSHSSPTNFPALDQRELCNRANSVLDLIYQKRTSDSTSIHSHAPPSKKLPFDTQSLRDLVIRAGVLTRALKEVVRKADGVSTSPDEEARSSNPPFSRIFNKPSNDDLTGFNAHDG